jgi:hypothetical protein
MFEVQTAWEVGDPVIQKQRMTVTLRLEPSNLGSSTEGSEWLRKAEELVL